MRLIIGLLVASLFFGLLQRAFPAVPPQTIWRRARRIDFLYWFFTPLVTRAIAAVAAGTVFVLLAPLIGWRIGSSWFASQPLAVQWLEVLIGSDLIGYGSHRLFHRRPLWPIHAIHHSSESLDWLAASRVHPLNEAIARMMQLAPMLLLGFDPRVVAAAVPFLTFYAVFLHANVRWDFGPLRYVIASPRFHRWHHTSEGDGLDKNFAGLFPWIDLLFGTFYMPAGRQPLVFGVPGEGVPTTFVAQLAYPFQRSKNL